MFSFRHNQFMYILMIEDILAWKLQVIWCKIQVQHELHKTLAGDRQKSTTWRQCQWTMTVLNPMIVLIKSNLSVYLSISSNSRQRWTWTLNIISSDNSRKQKVLRPHRLPGNSLPPLAWHSWCPHPPLRSLDAVPAISCSLQGVSSLKTVKFAKIEM